MIKLQKVGLIMAIISAILWIVGLIAGLYSVFSDQTLAIPSESAINSEVGVMHGVKYLIYYVLIVIFAVGIGLILEECSKKSLKKSLTVLIVSCLLGWLCGNAFYWFLGLMCGGCVDPISHIFGIFYLLFLVLRFLSLFFSIKYLISKNGKIIAAMLSVFILLVVLFVGLYSSKEYLLGRLKSSITIMSWLLFVVSIIVCIIAGIKSYKEKKKSS